MISFVKKNEFFTCLLNLVNDCIIGKGFANIECYKNSILFFQGKLNIFSY